MKKLFFAILFLFVCTITAFPQWQKAYKAKFFITQGDTLPYRILLPKDFNPKQKYPLVLFLHGAGERGYDNLMQLKHGGNLFSQKEVQEKYPAVIIFPQCPRNSYWANVDVSRNSDTLLFNFKTESEPTQAMVLLLGLVDSLQKEAFIDKGRMYVGGLSMGGMGTFELLRRKPNTFAAAFPICGGDSPDNVPTYANSLSFWVFHGAKDDVVSLKYSEQVVKKLKESGADVKFTMYPEVKHDSWTNAFAEPELLPWLFSKQK